MRFSRSPLPAPKSRQIVILVLSALLSLAFTLSARVTALSLFQSPQGFDSPLSPLTTPSPTPPRSATRVLTPFPGAGTVRPGPTLARPTLVPTLTRTPTATPTVTHTPTLPAVAKTATVVARAFLPPPTLVVPGLVSPNVIASDTTLTGAGEAPGPRLDPARPTPAARNSLLTAVFSNGLVVLSYLWLCFAVVVLAGGTVAAVWVFRRKPGGRTGP